MDTQACDLHRCHSMSQETKDMYGKALPVGAGISPMYDSISKQTDIQSEETQLSVIGTEHHIG